MAENNYFTKILALMLATAAGIFAIWFALIRQDSADWITSQVVHQASPYAVSEDGDGLIISNVVAGYEFKAPVGFKSAGARNLSFYLENGGQKKCEIRHYVKKPKVKLEKENLVFELTNQEEIGCEKYLLTIRDSVLLN